MAQTSNHLSWGKRLLAMVMALAMLLAYLPARVTPHVHAETVTENVTEPGSTSVVFVDEGGDLFKAIDSLPDAGGTVVVRGDVNISTVPSAGYHTWTPKSGKIVVTGLYNGHNYSPTITFSGGSNKHNVDCASAIEFNHLTLNHTAGSSTDIYTGPDLVIGYGMTFLASGKAIETDANGKICFRGGSYDDLGAGEDTRMEFYSGRFSYIQGGSRQKAVGDATIIVHPGVTVMDHVQLSGTFNGVNNVNCIIDGADVKNVYVGGYSDATRKGSVNGNVNLTLKNGVFPNLLGDRNNTSATVSGNLSLTLDAAYITSWTNLLNNLTISGTKSLTVKNATDLKLPISLEGWASLSLENSTVWVDTAYAGPKTVSQDAKSVLILDDTTLEENLPNEYELESKAVVYVGSAEGESATIADAYDVLTANSVKGGIVVLNAEITQKYSSAFQWPRFSGPVTITSNNKYFLRIWNETGSTLPVVFRDTTKFSNIDITKMGTGATEFYVPGELTFGEGVDCYFSGNKVPLADADGTFLLTVRLGEYSTYTNLRSGKFVMHSGTLNQVHGGNGNTDIINEEGKSAYIYIGKGAHVNFFVQAGSTRNAVDSVEIVIDNANVNALFLGGYSDSNTSETGDVTVTVVNTDIPYVYGERNSPDSVTVGTIHTPVQNVSLTLDHANISDLNLSNFSVVEGGTASLTLKNYACLNFTDADLAWWKTLTLNNAVVKLTDLEYAGPSSATVQNSSPNADGDILVSICHNDSLPTVTGAEVIFYNTHTYAHPCSANCSVCAEPNPAPANHDWSNKDGVCAVCGATCESLDGHANGNADHECDLCGKTLSECHYAGDCDASCDLCGATRETTAEHSWFEGTCSVCGATDPDYVDTVINNLEELQAALAAGGEYTLGADITLNCYLTSTYTTTIDMCGYKITGYSTSNRMQIATQNSGKQTITLKNGTLENIYLRAYYGNITLHNITLTNGKVVADSGVVSMTDVTMSSPDEKAITVNGSPSNLYIFSGDFTGLTSSKAFFWVVSPKIYGGTYNINWSSYFTTPYVSLSNGDGTYTVTTHESCTFVDGVCRCGKECEHSYAYDCDSSCDLCGATRETEGHNLSGTEASAPSCLAAGHAAYWQCTNCEAYFADAEATTAIENIETWLAKGGEGYSAQLDHDFNGMGGRCLNGCEKKECQYTGEHQEYCAYISDSTHAIVCLLCAELLEDPVDCSDATGDGNHTCDYCSNTAEISQHSWADGVCSECSTECNHVNNTPDHICDLCGVKIDTCDDWWDEGLYFPPTFDADGYWEYTCRWCGDTKKVTDEGTKLTAVARIGDERFATLEAAFAAAQDGDVIQVLVTTSLNEVVTVDKEISVIGAYTRSSSICINATVADVFTVVSGGELTLGCNLTVNGSTSVLYAVSGGIINVDGATLNGKTSSTARAEGQGSVINVISGSIYSEDAAAISASANAAINISGGTMNGSVGVTDGAALAVSGGSFDEPVDEEYCVNGYIPTDNGDGSYGVKIGEYVARNATTGVGYETLAEAIAAAQSGETVKLLTDVTLSEQLVIDKDVTITADSAATITVTIANGSTGAAFGGLHVTNGTLTLGANVTVTNVGSAENGVSTVTTTGSNAKLVVDGAIVKSECKNNAIEAANGSYVTILSGEVYGTAQTAAYASGGATIEVKGGKVGNALYNYYGLIASKTAATTGGNIIISGGEVRHVLAHEAANATVTITGGTITGVVGANNGAVVTVSGGTFENPVAEEYCADGYIPTANEDGTYGVKIDDTHTHKLTKVGGIAPGYTTPGNTDYWTCECGKFFNAEGEEIEEGSWILPARGTPNKVYVSDSGSDVNTGLTADQAFKTLKQAYRYLAVYHPDSESTIIVCGKVTISEDTTMLEAVTGKVTITSLDGETNYAETNSAQIYFASSNVKLQFEHNTELNNITLHANAKSGFLFTGLNMVIGKNVTTSGEIIKVFCADSTPSADDIVKVTMQSGNFNTVFMGGNTKSTNGNVDLIIDGAEISDFVYCGPNSSKSNPSTGLNTNLTIKSGYVRVVYASPNEYGTAKDITINWQGGEILKILGRNKSETVNSVTLKITGFNDFAVPSDFLTKITDSNGIYLELIDFTGTFADGKFKTIDGITIKGNSNVTYEGTLLANHVITVESGSTLNLTGHYKTDLPEGTVINAGVGYTEGAQTTGGIVTYKVLYGDADGNGTVDINDANHIKQYRVGLVDEANVDLVAADADGNGKVDVYDAYLIQILLAGKISSLPVNN